RQYQRGPSDSGIETSSLARAASEFVKRHHREATRTTAEARISVFLAGYSRGAAAVIEAAHQLRDANIDIECLLLCDAVERTVGNNFTTIPGNVVRCFHAVRDPMAMSRRWMGNCGRTLDDPGATRYIERIFHCTH